MSDGATQAAIEAHYDVGRHFYRLWLDRAMVYSCALWPGALDDDLEAAQQAKLAWHADGAGIRPGARVLDVGCGWGAMLHYLVEQRGAAQVTGLTLSSDQADQARTLLAGLPVDHEGQPHEVRLEDWRLHHPPRPYDGIISIGAFEHFTHQGLDRQARREVYQRFFDRCAHWLVPGGYLSLQTIAYEDFDEAAGAVSSFFTEEIFPESALPHLSDIVAAAEGSFRLLALRSDAEQYEHTLHLWQQRLETQREAAVELTDRSTYRRYLKYLRVSRAMFDRRVCTLYRVVFQRRPNLPTR